MNSQLVPSAGYGSYPQPGLAMPMQYFPPSVPQIPQSPSAQSTAMRNTMMAAWQARQHALWQQQAQMAGVGIPMAWPGMNGVQSMYPQNDGYSQYSHGQGTQFLGGALVPTTQTYHHNQPATPLSSAERNDPDQSPDSDTDASGCDQGGEGEFRTGSLGDKRPQLSQCTIIHRASTTLIELKLILMWL
jgi:hypothetical protein